MGGRDCSSWIWSAKSCLILWLRKVGLKVDEMKPKSVNPQQQGDWKKEMLLLLHRLTHISTLLLYSRNIHWHPGAFKTSHTSLHLLKNNWNLAQPTYSVISPPFIPTLSLALILVSMNSIFSYNNMIFHLSHFECTIPLPRMNCFLLPICRSLSHPSGL